MIRDHELNSRWWGRPAGYVFDPAFFHRPEDERLTAMAPYDWIETTLPIEDSATHADAMSRCGFGQVDTQVRFRINISRVPKISESAALSVRFASDEPFAIAPGTLAVFDKERFLGIPGISQSRVNERFELWSERLIQESPEHCMQILYDGEVQGWFLSQTGKEKGLNLTLAMLSQTAIVSGMYVYQRALQAYAERGQKLGWASFSVTNTPVHNIYAGLGAHFLPPYGNWLWVDRARLSAGNSGASSSE